MGYYDLDIDAQEKEDAQLLKIRVENFVDKKCDKGIDKGLITDEESKQLLKVMAKQIKKGKDLGWWVEQNGNKSFDIAMELLEDLPEQEILKKIEKA